MAHHEHTADAAHHDEKPHGITRWLTTTNHKDIGTMYLVFSLAMFLIGGLFAMVIRADQEHRQREHQVHRADVLVVRGRQPASDAVGLLVVVGGVRRVLVVCHVGLLRLRQRHGLCGL